MVLARRSFLFSVLIYAAFFASGASSLIAEVTWNRMLITVVGNSISATAMIVVVFMGGLGLGSYAGGKVFSARRPSLVPYLLLETAIGAYVVLSPKLFHLLSGLFTSLASSVNHRVGLTVIRVIVTAAALLLPATLMGSTFPAMISGSALDAPSQRTARTGYLYSLNTLGAAVGCFVAGYHLLLEFGVRLTLFCAFGLSLVAALLGLAAQVLRDRQRGLELSMVSDTEVEASGGQGVPLFLGAATFGIGFVALAYEVLLTRLSILYLGNSVSVFPLVLTAFLLGTGISAVLGTRLFGLFGHSPSSARRFFAIVALAAGAAVLATPYLLLSDWVLGAHQFARFADAGSRNPWPILAIIVAPTILIGGLLPIAIRMLQPSQGSEATRGAANLYALNTAGGLLGAGLANHLLVPLIGTHGVLAGLSSICATMGIVGLLPQQRRNWRLPAALLTPVALTLLLVFSLPRIADLYSRMIADSTGARSAQVRLTLEGRAATVTVVDQEDPTLGTYRDMYLNGVEEASTRYWHTQLFKLLGIFPVLAHSSDESKQVLVIAFGAGITAGSVLASKEVSSLEVVDLNPDVEGINNLFVDVNGDVFHKSRFHFHNDDGRNYLVTSHEQYDVIINDSTHPRAYDSWILYTEEFYRAVRRRLRRGGVFAQWVPVLGSMQGDLFKIHLNTFRRVFPNATFWYIYGSDQAFLLATPEPFSLDVARLQRQLDQLPQWFRADEYQIDTAARVAGFFWMDGAAMGRMIGAETRVNTDDAHYFDKQSAVWPSPPRARLPFFQANVLPYLEQRDGGLDAAVQTQQRLGLMLAAYGFFGSKDDLFEAYCTQPKDGNVRYYMSREFANELPDHDAFCRDLNIKHYRALVATHPRDALAWNALADLLSEAGGLDEAQKLAEKAVALAPDNGMILDTYGWILLKQRKLDLALQTLRRSSSLLPNHPIVLYHLGAACYAAGKVEEGRLLLEKALVTSTEFSGAEEARRLLGR